MVVLEVHFLLVIPAHSCDSINLFLTLLDFVLVFFDHCLVDVVGLLVGVSDVWHFCLSLSAL